MTDDRHEPFGPPQEFADEFLRWAEPAVRDIFTRRCSGHLESLVLDHRETPGAGLVISATATLEFRGARYTHTRTVWPPDHPARTQAGLYATMLEERLLTRPRPVPADDS